MGGFQVFAPGQAAGFDPNRDVRRVAVRALRVAGAAVDEPELRGPALRDLMTAARVTPAALGEALVVLAEAIRRAGTGRVRVLPEALEEAGFARHGNAAVLALAIIGAHSLGEAALAFRDHTRIGTNPPEGDFDTLVGQLRDRILRAVRADAMP